MARACLLLAVLGPVLLIAGWMMLSVPAGGRVPVSFALVPIGSGLCTLVSAVIGLRCLIAGPRENPGTLASGLVIDYCWFRGLLAAAVVHQLS